MSMGKVVLTVLVLGGLAGLGWAIHHRLQEESGPARRARGEVAAPVEAETVERGPIELRRTFSGTLEASSAFVVAPKVSGQVIAVEVDLADTVLRGQVVVELDDDEFEQAVAQAKADVAVAEAKLAEARSALETARRGLARIETLSGRGVASEVQLDAARADETARKAEVAVAVAQVTRAEASLESARIRLRYTRIPAGWTRGSETRVVARRWVDPGDTVSHGTALLEIIEIDTVTAVVHVAERDYARLAVGQHVALATDAYPGERFEGTVARIAPVFDQSTRQARVEIGVPNPDRRLKPGMFVRATLVLARAEDVWLLPETALATRDGQRGVFVVDVAAGTVAWQVVEIGIRTGDRVQALGEGFAGPVVTLGHQLLENGAKVIVAGDGRAGTKTAPEGARKDGGTR